MALRWSSVRGVSGSEERAMGLELLEEVMVVVGVGGRVMGVAARVGGLVLGWIGGLMG